MSVGTGGFGVFRCFVGAQSALILSSLPEGLIAQVPLGQMECRKMVRKIVVAFRPAQSNMREERQQVSDTYNRVGQGGKPTATRVTVGPI